MKRPRGVLLIFIMSICFFLCMASDIFALFRDDVSVEEAEEWVGSEREKSKIKLKKRQGEAKEEILKLEEVVTLEEKQVPSSVSLAKKTSSALNKKITIGAVCLVLIIAIVFGSRFLFTNKT